MFRTLVIYASLLGSVLLGLSPALAQQKPHRLTPKLVELWRVETSLSRPESVIYDARRDVLYISNINGGATDKDGNGYIARISPEGDILDPAWITGLNAPKGMAISGDYLYVSDIDRLVEISLATQQIVNIYTAADAQFFNDVAADKSGDIYVSDSGRQTLYRLHKGDFDIWLDDPRISEPNGLFAKAGRLIVAAGDATAERPGRSRYLQGIDYRKKSIKPVTDSSPIGSLDGVEKTGMGGYFLTDFREGNILFFSKAQGVINLLTPEVGTADIDYVADQNRLYVPILNSGKLIAYRVLWCQ